MRTPLKQFGYPIFAVKLYNTFFFIYYHLHHLITDYRELTSGSPPPLPGAVLDMMADHILFFYKMCVHFNIEFCNHVWGIRFINTFVYNYVNEEDIKFGCSSLFKTYVRNSRKNYDFDCC